MKCKAVYFFFLTGLATITGSQAQNLTGTWEGRLSSEFIQINIIQKNDELCGYTYDHFYNDRRNYCKAYFKGHYDKKQRAWLLSGISFIENSGTHVLMNIKLWNGMGNDEDIMEGTVGIKSGIGFILTLGSKEYVEMRRVSDRPAKLPNNMPPCFPDENRSNDPERPEKKQTLPEVNKIPPKIPADPVQKKPVDPVLPPPVIVKKRVDTVQVPAVVKKDSSQQFLNMIVRKNSTISRIPVSVKNITLNLYDNATVDGDTVTVFYNGKILVSKQRLSEKPIVINLDLDEKAALHEITLYAENLGSIPPNTALIVVTAGDKRYELHSSASLEENAVLIFEYKPK